MSKILVINPGSTSTKLSLYEDEKELFKEDIFHDTEILKSFPSINDELPFRMQVLEAFILKYHIDMEELAAIACRGGASYSVKSGTYLVDELLVNDTKACKGGLYHASMLGVQMAYLLGQKYHIPVFMSDPTVIDEYDELAHITGIDGIYRKAASHVLNQKAVARKYAASINRPYEELNLIVAHIDGGISINAHLKGQMVDGIDGGGGEGPFTPTRMGAMAVSDVVNYLWDKSKEEMRQLLHVSGGLANYFGTADMRKIMTKIANGDQKAFKVYKAMLYQSAKVIGSMASVLKGEVDAILLTGGLLKYDDVLKTISPYISWIAPIKVYPGEYEQEALALNALKVLRGEKKALKYEGKAIAINL